MATKNKVSDYWHMLGPGLTTGAADDDPSGIATYSQAGAGFGFKFLWTAAFTFPFMAIIQEMCARIGIVTGRGLAGAVARNYPRWILYLWAVLLFVANTFNLGADLGIMAKAVELLVPINFAVLLIAFTALTLYLQIFTTYQSYARILKWVALVLLAYVFTGFIVHVDWASAAKYILLPKIAFNKDSLIILTAILGTTISPYLFFWQTSQEVEEQIMEGKTSLKQRQAQTTPAEIRKMRVDVWSGMFLSNLVVFFIIVVCAATLFSHGITQISDASQAALALKPLAGNFAFLLFTIGIIGTGLLGIPVLAGWRSGHCDPNLTLPMGAQVRLDAGEQVVVLEQDVVFK